MLARPRRAEFHDCLTERRNVSRIGSARAPDRKPDAVHELRLVEPAQPFERAGSEPVRPVRVIDLNPQCLRLDLDDRYEASIVE